jgi:hypothetical protein
MYKRPSPRVRSGYSGSQTVPLNAPGLLGDIVRSMAHNTVKPPPPREWVPPLDHESYFKSLRARGDDTTRLEQLAKEYYEKHPKPPPNPPKPVYNYEPIYALNDKYYSKCKQPPLPVMVKAMREVGYSEERVDKHIKWVKKMEDTYEERTEKIEKIFAKWPSASKGAKSKVIKAVKKKM